MKTCIVTGGGGFVGKALCLRLLREGYRVVSLSRDVYPELKNAGIECVQLDLGEESIKLKETLRGAHAVFHVAAMVKMWGRYDEFYKINVEGTKKILEVCERCGIPYFIYTSSPSVIADGNNLRGIDESYPYPTKYKSFYARTKALGEQIVLEYARRGVLKALSLRPHLIFGPGDTSLTATVIEKARQGKLRRIGEGDNLVDFTFIDDCVTAHILALRALESNPNANGRTFFISQGDPVKLWEWIDRVLELNGLPKVSSSIPVSIATIAASLSELIWKVFRLKNDPPLTRFLVSEMCTDHYFSIEAAKKELGYLPSRTVFQALEPKKSS